MPEGDAMVSASGDRGITRGGVCTPANLVRFTILNVSPCSDQHTRSSETGDETISYSLSRKGATLSTSNAPALSSVEKMPIPLLHSF